jgi:MarR family transcriptional regulator, lower aerobic nicotinate degradation pathway regulator
VIMTSDEMLNTHGILLRRCQQVALALFSAEAADLGFSPTQYSALAFIYNEPGIHQNVLGDRIALDRSSVTKCVEILEERGLIRREVDRTDKRARLMFITQDGKSMLEHVSAAAIRARRRIMGAMGEDQFLALLAGLKAFSEIDLSPPA